MALRTVQRLDEIERPDRWAARIEASGGHKAALGALLDSVRRARTRR
jgi:hypothetical protein